MKKKLLLISLFILFLSVTHAQPDRWQQKVKYVMDIHLDVKTNLLKGKQKLKYTNNSPDTLCKVFFHLYWNAFQPNSMMDIHKRFPQRAENEDLKYNDRIGSRIANLKPDEIGFQNIKSIKIDGEEQYSILHETILEVFLSKPIRPKSTVVFDIDFEAQVPLLIRRAGRDNPGTGVRYSMAQWYPKICEYDREGWHPTPYVEHEFYGVWGDFDVNISIDKSYVLGGTGTVVNAQRVGYGYEQAGKRVKRPNKDELKWHFKAKNVHDFMWAADPYYIHLQRDAATGTKVHLLYKNIKTLKDSDWNLFADAAGMLLPYIESKFGKYQYKQISIIEGGDTGGGMEYPMGCLVGGPSLNTGIHEMMHNWFQGMIGNNESTFGWMDEGFTSYATAVVLGRYIEMQAAKYPDSKYYRNKLISQKKSLPLYHSDAYDNYFYLAKSGREEPLSTHADHYYTDHAYWSGVYSKGELFLSQLAYIVGEQMFDRIMLAYYQSWHFKHPDVTDFIKVAEDLSGMKLDWYKEYWIYTTKTIDYGIADTWEDDGATNVKLKMIGKMPMPIDVLVVYKDGNREMIYIPQYLMFGGKQSENKDLHRTTLDAWKWTSLTYTLKLNHPLSEIKSIEIDPSQRMADVDRRNNKYQGE